MVLCCPTFNIFSMIGGFAKKTCDIYKLSLVIHMAICIVTILGNFDLMFKKVETRDWNWSVRDCISKGQRSAVKCHTFFKPMRNNYLLLFFSCFYFDIWDSGGVSWQIEQNSQCAKGSLWWFLQWKVNLCVSCERKVARPVKHVNDVN